MRIPIGGGPAETVMDVKGGFVRFLWRRPHQHMPEAIRAFAAPRMRPEVALLAEADDTQITFSAFDPVQGRKAELVKVPANKELTRWDLSPDGSRVALSAFRL